MIGAGASLCEIIRCNACGKALRFDANTNRLCCQLPEGSTILDGIIRHDPELALQGKPEMRVFI